jgi:hypothetical protein
MNKALLTGLLASAAMFVAASDTRASDDGAEIFKDIQCSASASTSGLGVLLFATTGNIDVATNGGNITRTCHFNIPAGFEPAKAIVHKGFPCAIISKQGLVVHTTDTQIVSSPGGTAVLRCQIKANQS